MKTKLYLDTARFGLPSLEVRNTQIDSLHLTMEEGCSIYFGSFLKNGFNALPQELQVNYSDLSSWKGLNNLKEGLNKFTEANSNIIFSSRTFELARFSIGLLFKRSKRPLSTDLDWPEYAQLLNLEESKTESKRVLVPIKNKIFQDKATEEEIIQTLTQAYIENGCDSLFLTLVSNDGIRLPVEKIVASILKITKRPKFIVIDGAQAFNHIPISDALKVCDIFITGTHKWFRAHHPMGLGFCPNPHSKEFIEHSLQKELDSFNLTDPLIGFTQEILLKSERAFGETVNVTPLLTAQAALNKARSKPLIDCYRQQLKNAQTLKALLLESNWRVIEPKPEFQTGIFLLEPYSPESFIGGADPRNIFQHYKVSVTQYSPHFARISVPKEPLSTEDLEVFYKAVHSSPVSLGLFTRPYFES